MGVEMREKAGSHTAGGMQAQCAERIVMLVPHEPELDPRIRWVTQMCAQIAPTHILATVSSKEIFDSRGRPLREYNDRVYVERVDRDEYASKTAKCFSVLAGLPSVKGAIRRFVQRENLGRLPLDKAVRNSSQHDGSQKPLHPGVMTSLARSLRDNPVWRAFRAIDHRVGGAFRCLSTLTAYALVASAIYRRARALSIIPCVVICHDIHALAAAVKIKKLYGCPIIYDSHEFWPEGDLLAPAWQRRLTTYIERKIIRHADAVVTVSPQLARCLASLYGVPKVISAPNAEPRGPSVTVLREESRSAPLKILFQGQVALRRGIEELLAAWSQVDEKEAVLYLRCPENDYLAELRRTFKGLLDQGKVIILQPVPEKDLIPAATFGDLGIIPYVGPNLNHVYCCPNKLSQYMQAGLAILSNKLEFVSEVIRRFECGLTYDAGKPETLVEAIRFLIANPKVLQTMQHNARRGARSEFNWEVQSVEYKNAVRACVPTLR